MEGVSTAKIVLFHQGSTELRRCENCVFFLPVNILTGVTRRLLGPHDTLPCVLIYELNDLMFLIKSLNTPTDNFDIRNFISFNTNSTRSGSHLKLCHPRTVSTTHHHFYFNQIIRLWNHLPVINLSLPPYVIKQKLTKHLWDHFTVNFNSDQSRSFHLLCPCH